MSRLKSFLAVPARSSLRSAMAGAALLALCATFSGAGLAQQLTEQQMIDQLLGKTTRGAATPAPKQVTPADTARLRELLEKAATRAFSAKERTELAQATVDRPNIDFEVYFPFNSSSLTPTAHETLQKVGQLLKNPAFTGKGFLIAGHTDAKGRPEPNRVVSQRRAESVRAYLVKRYGIDPSLIRVVGYGFEQLKDKANPNSSINRRVQIINLPDGTLTASR